MPERTTAISPARTAVLIQAKEDSETTQTTPKKKSQVQGGKPGPEVIMYCDKIISKKSKASHTAK